MKHYGRRLIISSILLYLLTFAGLLIYSFIMFEEKRLLLSFKTPWVIDQALIHLGSLLIPVQITAVIISYGLEIKNRDTEAIAPDPFHYIIKPAMIFFILMTAVFTVLCEGIIPGAHTRQQKLLYSTTVARNLIEKSDQARAEGQYREAYDYLEEYLEIDPDNSDQLEAQGELMDKILDEQSDARPGQEKEDTKKKRIKPAMTADEFIREAGYFFDQGDYFSAHYYATLAYAADPSRTDADQLAKQAWRKVNEMTPSVQEKEQYLLYEEKKRGFEALTAGHAMEAYYLFTRLEKNHPLDPDIKKYLEESRDAVRNISFFRDELEKTTRFPGVKHIVFMNIQNDTNRELIFIDTLTSIREGYYLFDVEIISFTADGSVLYHLKAPYGKIINNRLVTLCIDGEDSSKYFAAEYLEGSRPEAERNIIPLNIPPEMVARFSIQKGFLSTISLPFLWDLGKVYARFGMRRELVDIEITARLMKPLAFLLFAFLSLAVSWAMRPVYRRPALPGFLLLPLVPFVAYFLLMLYYYIARLFNGFLLITLGFIPTLIAIVAVQGLFLIFVFLYLAGQSTE